MAALPFTHPPHHIREYVENGNGTRVFGEVMVTATQLLRTSNPPDTDSLGLPIAKL